MTSKCGCLTRILGVGGERRVSGWCVRFVSASADRLAVLSIGKLGASEGQLESYERQVAAGAEDYYAGRGEMPGVWMGAGSAALDGEGWREDARARPAEHGFGPGELRALQERPRSVTSRPSLRAVVARLSGPEGLTGSHDTFVRRHALAELAGEFAADTAISVAASVRFRGTARSLMYRLADAVSSVQILAA